MKRARRTPHRPIGNRLTVALLTLATALSAAGCGDDDGQGDVAESGAYDWQLPKGFPVPSVPVTNPMSEAKVELGRRLFYDVRLSGDESMSCASCHQQELAFTDGNDRSMGITEELHARSPMSLTNVAYAPALNWANPVVRTLEDQALTPLFGDAPVELGIHSVEQLEEILSSVPFYQDSFAEAFPNETDPLNSTNVLKALASFQRTLISGGSRYDQYQYGEPDALTEAEKRGKELFFSERTECFHCHGGFNFSDSVNHSGVIASQAEFHNNGLFNVGGEGGYPFDNRGLYEFTGEASDEGKFRAPTLRNIGVTAPYMHDGSILTLREVVDHYARGGRLIESGEYAGDGAESPNRSPFVTGFVISNSEAEDLVAFIESLTDNGFLTDERFSDPWGDDAQEQ